MRRETSTAMRESWPSHGCDCARTTVLMPLACPARSRYSVRPQSFAEYIWSIMNQSKPRYEHSSTMSGSLVQTPRAGGRSASWLNSLAPLIGVGSLLHPMLWHPPHHRLG